MRSVVKIAVWSSSSPLYCECIVNGIFPNPSSLEFVWASDRCSRVYDLDCGERYWRKNIRKIKDLGHALENIIAVDDTFRKWEKSYGNVIVVGSFAGEGSDQELRLLIPYLDWLRKQPNVRSIEKRDWRRRVTVGLSA